MSKVCKEFVAKDGALFGHEYSHQPGGPCRQLDDVPQCDTEGFKVVPRLDQESDSE